MQIQHTRLDGVLLITPDIFRDERGWFMESFSAPKLREQAGISTVFVQDNHIRSTKPGVLRGIHFQNEPFAQAKLLRCTVGRVMDYAVDLREGSPTYLQWVCAELTADNFTQIFIPRGFGHAVVSLTEESEIQYKVDSPYSGAHDRSIRWDDPSIAIEWPFPAHQLVLSEKDRLAPLLKDSDCNFRY